MSKGRLLVTSGVGGDRPRIETALRGLLLVLPLLLGQVPAAQAQVSVGIGVEMPGISIGINLPSFPDLQRVPGYPVYYAPHAPGNYFYYDGLYWVLQGDDWYASSWYNGPWQRVMPLYVPAYVLRVPVYYYRQPPPYFRVWRADAPPRWDEHWGREWQQRRPGWNHWDRHAAPPPAPLPTYQRRYPHSRYPQESARQQAIRAEHFDDRPREPVSRQAYEGPDRYQQHQQGRPAQPSPWPHAQQPRGQQDRPPEPRQQAAPQERGHPKGRAELSNPSPPYLQVRRVQPTQPRPASAQAPRAQPAAQPRPQPNAQQPPRPQERLQVAYPSHGPNPQAATQDRDQPRGRAQTAHRRPDKLG